MSDVARMEMITQQVLRPMLGKGSDLGLRFGMVKVDSFTSFAGGPRTRDPGFDSMDHVPLEPGSVQEAGALWAFVEIDGERFGSPIYFPGISPDRFRDLLAQFAGDVTDWLSETEACWGRLVEFEPPTLTPEAWQALATIPSDDETRAT